MKQYNPSVGLEKLCGLFGKSRQAFYDQNNRQNDDQLKQGFIADRVKAIRKDLPQVGGLKLHFMIKDDLKAHGLYMGRDRFFELLKKYDLLVKRRKRFVRTTWSDHPYKKWNDLTQNLQLTATEQLWVSDITYLRTEGSFVYLSLISDAYSRKIVGYHLSQHLKVQGCLIALNKAISSLSSKSRVIHHSDRGIQYCCEPYVSTLQKHHIAISMTQSGSPYDNAIAERINGILKTEFNLHKTFASYSTAVAAVHSAIDAYNRIRPHLSLKNLTPNHVHLNPNHSLVKLNPYYCEQL